jgi:Uma2 family endonuclease
MLTLPRPLSLTSAQFAQACAAKPEAVLELDTDGMLIEEPPARGTSSARNPRP